MAKIVDKKTVAKDWGNFQEVEDRPRYRLIVRQSGTEKTGKDHFALTAPGPIAVLSFDIGLEGVVEKFLRAPLGPKEIRVTKYEFDKNNSSQDRAQEIRDQLLEDYTVALGRARSIIFDTETEVWELFRYAEFGEASDAPKNYVALNATYRDFLQKAYDADVNLFLIQRMKEKWITVEVTDNNGKKKEKPRATGIMEPVGFKDAGYLVQVNLRHTWSKADGFQVLVENCRQNMEIAGESYANLDFPTLGQLVFDQTDETDWK